MSETFLIKKTGFSNSSSITDKESNSFIIGPGELNGPGGILRDSDLKLYGFGSLKWGEGVNQNIIRLLENNACPAKVLNDYNPATNAYDYDPATDILLPRDEKDLGIGNGITVPYIGQSWYNLDNGLTYTLNSIGIWGTVVNADGSLTLGGLLDMDNNPIINVTDPSDAPTTLPISILQPQDVVTVGWADDRYINATGDSMTGDLTINSSSQLKLLNAGPLNSIDVGNLGFNDSRYVEITGDIITGSLAIDGNLTTEGTTSFNRTPTVGGDQVWHAGNDGHGSGLDADTIDGVHLSAILLNIYPIGAVYLSISPTNPDIFLGGVWEAFGQGQTLIGQKPGDPLFGFSTNDGGTAHSVTVSHNHSTSSSQASHEHLIMSNDYVAGLGGLTASNYAVNRGGRSGSQGYNIDGRNAVANTGRTTAKTPAVYVTVNSKGVSGNNANLPPYVVTYMWLRTA